MGKKETQVARKGKRALIKCLEERLKWQTYETTEEEFDVEEVTAIVELLDILEPIGNTEYFNAEKGLERFWKYYKQRESEEE